MVIGVAPDEFAVDRQRPFEGRLRVVRLAIFQIHIGDPFEAHRHVALPVGPLGMAGGQLLGNDQRAPVVFERTLAVAAVPDRDALFGHAVVGASWEGFVIETLIGCAPDWSTPYYYRTSDGQEIDLLLELPGGKFWAIEVKRGRSPKVEAGFHRACDDLKPARRFVIYNGTERQAVPQNIEAISLHDLANELLAISAK